MNELKLEVNIGMVEMKSVDKIIEYMKLKRELSHPLYLLPEDVVDIKNMPEEMHKKIWSKISTIPIHFRFGMDDCPFCIQCGNKCGKCLYANRHGRCSSSTSDWFRYIAPISPATFGIKPPLLLKLENMMETLNSFKHLGG